MLALTGKEYKTRALINVQLIFGDWIHLWNRVLLRGSNEAQKMRMYKYALWLMCAKLASSNSCISSNLPVGLKLGACQHCFGAHAQSAVV